MSSASHWKTTPSIRTTRPGRYDTSAGMHSRLQSVTAQPTRSQSTTSAGVFLGLIVGRLYSRERTDEDW